MNSPLVPVAFELFEQEDTMLDLAEAIDNSFLHTQTAPSFMAVQIVPTEGRDKAKFMRDMEERYQSHVDELETWITEGQTALETLAYHLRAAEFGLDQAQVARLLRLSDAIAKRAERSASSYAQMSNGLKKQARAFAKYSAPVSGFLVDLAARIEASLDREIAFLQDISDHYRGPARLYDPQNKGSEIFDDPADAIAFLKLA